MPMTGTSDLATLQYRLNSMAPYVKNMAKTMGMENPTKINTPTVYMPQIGNYSLLNYDANQGYASQQANLAQDRQAASMTGATIDSANADAARRQQMGIYDQLLNRNQSILRGDMQSQAELQMKKAQDKAIANTMGAVASVRGVNPAMQSRLIQTGLANQGQANAQDAAMLRMQEEQNAANAILGIGNNIGSVRNSDLAQATSQAQLDQSTAQSNLQAQQNQRALNDAMQQYFTGQKFNLDQTQSTMRQGYDQARMNQSIAQGNFSMQSQALQNQITQANLQAMQSLWGSLLGGQSYLMSKYGMSGTGTQGV